MSQGHSPLGFSGAERYFNCPGSVALIAALPPEAFQPDPDYTAAGTAAHAAWAECLREGLDAWAVADREWEGYRLTMEDLDAGQLYINAVRARIANAGEHLIEWRHHAPSIHPLAVGTIDDALIYGSHAVVTDYKHGEGIFVSVEHNKQLMGYAALLLDFYPYLTSFTLRIVQPRCAGAEPVREWSISADALQRWVNDELRPAMFAADPRYPNDPVDTPKGLNAGEWCRFCPVQKALACPEHNQIAEVIEYAPAIETVSDERLGDLFAKAEVLKMMIASIQKETLRRRLDGIDVPGTKTVLKKVFRVWKDGAEEKLKSALGPCVMTAPELKGPAELEKLGKMAKQLTKEYAYSPDAGYTVALATDRRAAIEIVPPAADTFDKYLDKLRKGE
jgi:Protein of unknown function (DUF2800)